MMKLAITFIFTIFEGLDFDTRITAYHHEKLNTKRRTH